MFSDELISPVSGETTMPTIMKPKSKGSLSIEKTRIETVAATTIIARSFKKSSVEWASI